MFVRSHIVRPPIVAGVECYSTAEVVSGTARVTALLRLPARGTRMIDSRDYALAHPRLRYA